MSDLTSIPEPKGWPIIGNILDIDLNFPLGSFEKWADENGEIFRVRFPGRNMIFVNTQALAHELCDERRFKKMIVAGLAQVGNGVRDGLFTVKTEDPIWGVGHRILMPAFGPMPIQDMFGEMHELAAQLVLKWARHPPTTPIMVTDDFTRLTLDTIALCSMGFRFNSFYHDKMHPFITAMSEFLGECGTRATLPPFIGQSRFRSATKKYWENIDILRKTAAEVLAARKEQPSTGGGHRKDLLSAMLDGVDPKTGQKLGDDVIIDNLITFLIAGHETTSGLLSFAIYQLLKHPSLYRKAQAEVDAVCGTGPIKAEHMTKLPFVSAVLRETLRHSPTIPTFFLEAIDDTVLGGKYFIPAGQPLAILLSKVHTDPLVHGDTANTFDPDRMLDENFERLSKAFPDFWKPFGNGQRGCIGRGFAWQEAVLCMAMVLQNLELSLDDESYELQIKQTLTTKPKDFYMRARLREGIVDATDLAVRLGGAGGAAHVHHANGKASQGKMKGGEGKPISIYYGSNTGTCEAFAERLAADAVLHGYEATVVEPLDRAKERLPKGQAVVVITASYEGQPPDNAKEFCEWMQGLKANELEKTQFAVFGCGHHDWTQTFHRVPKLVDETLEARGGERICPMGLADAAEGQIFTDFEQWEDEVFWPALEEKYGREEDDGGPQVAMANNLSVEFSSPRKTVLRQDVSEVVVVDAKVLTAEAKGQTEKKHLEVKLPAGMSYKAGDYLAVLPVNPAESVSRAMRRFHISLDAHVTIGCDGRTSLPTGVPVSVYDVLSSYVELGQPATKRSILALAESAASPTDKAALLSLANTPAQYTSEVTRKRTSLLALLEHFPSATPLFSTFLSLLPPLRVRTYSISSSPLRDPSRATLTYSVLCAPSLSDPSSLHRGVASSYLASKTAGDTLQVAVRSSHAAFHLPENPEATPVVMIAAGAGLAPFRGFVQERAAQIGAGRELAPALLFFGCRGSGVDDLYREELDKWEKVGAVSVRRAYSRSSDLGQETKGCRYVQERLWVDRLELMELWERGSKTYVCGSRGVGENVKKSVIRVAMEMQRLKVERGESEDEPSEQRAMGWFESILNDRYAVDLFD